MQPPTSTAVAIVAAANYKDRTYAANTLDLGQRSAAAAAANVAAVAAISKTLAASPLATTTANNNRRAMQRPILAGAAIASSLSLSADLAPSVTG